MDRFLLISGILLTAFLVFTPGKLQRRSSPLDAPITCFLLWMGTVWFFSDAREQGFPAIQLILAAVAFHEVCLRTWTDSHRRIFLAGLGAAGALLAIDFLSRRTGNPEGSLLLPNNLNYTAALLSVSWSMGLSVFLSPTPIQGRNAKAAIALAMGLCLAALIFMRSRGALASVSLVSLGLLSLRFSWKGFCAGMVGLGLIAVLLPQEMRSSLIKSKDPYAYERKTIWSVAGRVIENHPVLGVGPGRFEWAYDRYALPVRGKIGAYGRTTPHAHSEILQLAAEGGLPALALIVWGIVLGLRALWPQLRQDPWVLAAASGALALMLQASVDIVLLLPILLFLLAGLWAVALGTLPSKSVKASSRDKIFAGLFLLFTVAGSAKAMGDQWLNMGFPQRSVRINPWNAAAWKALGSEVALRKAVALAPEDPEVWMAWGRYLFHVRAASPDLRQESLAMALDAFNQAARWKPWGVFDRIETVSLFLYLKEYARAEETLHQTLRLEPNFMEAYALLGDVYRGWGKKRPAEIVWHQEIVMQRRLAQKSETANDYERELITLNQARIWNDLAGLYFEDGKTKEAKSALQLALKLEPENETYQANWKRLTKPKPKAGKRRNVAR